SQLFATRSQLDSCPQTQFSALVAGTTAIDADRCLSILFVWQRTNFEWPTGAILCSATDGGRSGALSYGARRKTDRPPSYLNEQYRFLDCRALFFERNVSPVQGLALQSGTGPAVESRPRLEPNRPPRRTGRSTHVLCALKSLRLF